MTGCCLLAFTWQGRLLAWGFHFTCPHSRWVSGAVSRAVIGWRVDASMAWWGKHLHGPSRITIDSTMQTSDNGHQR